MGKNWLWVVGVLFLFVSMMVGVALLIGQWIPTSTVTVYHAQEGIRYPKFIRDTSRGMALQLTGRRCFRELPLVPEWNATRQQYQPSYYPETVQVKAEARDALNQLRC